MKITLIAAIAQNRVLGNGGAIPWHIPEDFAFFKAYTTGKPIIMGRKTWESLPKKPLPSRRNIVISRQSGYRVEGAEVFADFQAALSECRHRGEPEAVIIGGGEIYRQTLPTATDLCLTEIALTPAGDTYFPEFSRREWHETAREHHVSQNGIAFDFVHYERQPEQTGT